MDGGEPRPVDLAAVAVEIDEDTRRVVRRIRRPLVGEDRPEIVLHRPGLGLRCAAGAVVGLVALVVARLTAAVPLKLEVAVEIDAAVVGSAAVVVVGVLAPVCAELGATAAVGVEKKQQVDLVLIEKPGCIGVGVIAVEEFFGESCEEFRPGAFPGVDAPLNKEDRFGVGIGRCADARRLPVAELEDHEIVAVEAGFPARVHLPGVADVDPLGEIRIVRDEALDIGKSLVDGSIARQAHDARLLTEKRAARCAHGLGELVVDHDIESGGLEAREFFFVDINHDIALGPIDLPGIGPPHELRDHGRVGK